ncbi:MAG: low affinity iron permease family protein [Pseudolabrys sp.]
MNRKKPEPKGGQLEAKSRQRARSRGHELRHYFEKFAQAAAHAAGSPATFLVAAGSIVVWAAAGFIFRFSDTWQLVINTTTTIITFLMVFLIQNTQNRDALATQLKLSELIIAADGAKKRVAAIEDLSDEDLERLHQHMSTHVATMRSVLDRRRR